MTDTYETVINNAWQARSNDKNYLISNKEKDAINSTLDLLDSGAITIMEQNENNDWIQNQWIKKAILLYFTIAPTNMNYSGFPGCFDKVPLKFEKWQEDDFIKAKIRAVPGSIVRFGSSIGKNVVLMPSFINIGAKIGDNCMIDTWATVGSCAYIGKNCHISGGAGIAGILEPLQANPVVIEDDCFIGGRCQIAEGTIVGKGSVIATGVTISASTPIIDRHSGEIFYGKIPPYSVVIPGTFNKNNSNDSLNTKDFKINPDKISYACAIIVKKIDAKTKSKTSINELLR